MELRAKLARLRSSSSLQPGVAGTPAIAQASIDAAARALAPAPEVDAVNDAAFATPQSVAFASHKAERIARLRALISEISGRAERNVAQGRVHGMHPERSAETSGSAARRAFPTEPTPHGTLHVVTRWLEPDHHHGRVAVHSALRAAAGTLSVLTRSPELDGIDLTRALFLDTETTGLAGGTGTVAFLVGLARFEEGVLCLEQLIVPNLGSEAPVLSRLAERIATASCVITYNGKSFDWPLLRTRFVMSRLAVPALPPHIDLLHSARALWKRRFDSLRLTQIEREVLGFVREYDVPGAEIPARYFRFLRDGETDRLAPVLEHNQNDLIALAALLGALITRLEGVATQCDVRDALAFGRLALRVSATEHALSCARAALANSADAVCTHDALVFESAVQKRLGRNAQAAELLERALAHAATHGQRSALHFALAKLYEHQLADPARALRHARQTEALESATAHGRRLGRLHRRLLRRASESEVAREH